MEEERNRLERERKQTERYGTGRKKKITFSLQYQRNHRCKKLLDK